MTEIFVRTDQQGAVGLVMLDRPTKYNALNRAMLDQLVEALRRFEETPTIRAIVLSGHPKAFAAGADIGALADADAITLFTSGFSESWDAVAAIKTPLIAAVSGYALGGGLELALLCDIIVADHSAIFGLPEAGIGTIPGAGGTQRLIRTVGKSIAMEMLLSGRQINGEEALRIGLISSLVDIGAVETHARTIADRIARAAPLAVGLAKSAALESFEMPLSAGIRYERSLSSLLAASADRHEGIRAFATKTQPDFQGR